eukprot:NODE_9_length_64580_cov_1.431941.p35 type:complete len:232 gc:universal NODE_9_length_64580_cov_1.431941:8688-7993(-)
MTSPGSTSFFEAIRKTASPIFDRIKNAISPISRSAPTTPVVSPTKAPTHRAPRTISSSLRDKNKTLSLGKPIDKVYKVPLHIAKKKQPRMAYVKKLKDPNADKTKTTNYLDDAFNACKKEGKILKINRPKPLLVEKKKILPKTNTTPMDVDNEHIPPSRTQSIYSSPMAKVSEDRRRRFAPPPLEDPEYIEKFPFTELNQNQVHFSNYNETIQNLDNWTSQNKPSNEFIFK